MRIEKPMCNFQNCKYHQDGNCVNASRYENCKLTDLHSEIARLRVDLDNAKADTVRKMQSEIKARCIEGGIYPAFVERVIDQIAKEMLEGTTPTNNANTCICCGAIIPEGVLTCPKCDKEREV